MNTPDDSIQQDTKLKDAIRNGVRFSTLILAVGALLGVLNIFPLGVPHSTGGEATTLVLLGLLGSSTFSVIRLIASRITTLETALRELKPASK